MPFARPTLSELEAQAAADIASGLPGADALLRFSNLGILGMVEAAMANGHYGYLDWIALQCTPFTATGEYLEAWAGLKGVTREPAVAAQETVQFVAAVATPPLQILAAANVVRGDNETYAVNATATAAGGLITVTVTDANPGAQGSCQTGTAMTLGSPVAGITSTGATTGQPQVGVDVETRAALRTRMLEAYAAPPQGGDLADYVTWCLQVPGVTRAWDAGTVPLGAGTVQLFVMLDIAEAAHGGFPQGTNGVAANVTRAAAATGDQLTVANWIYPLRPVTALVYVYAPVNNAVAFTIEGLAGASSATKTAVEAAIAGVFLAEAAPGGVTDAQGNALPPTYLDSIEEAIAAVAGAAGFVITAMSCPDGTIAPAGVGNVTSNAGYLATLGTVTWI